MTPLTETKSSMQEPPHVPPVATALEDDDPVRRIAEQIDDLTTPELRELYKYLEGKAF